MVERQPSSRMPQSQESGDKEPPSSLLKDQCSLSQFTRTITTAKWSTSWPLLSAGRLDLVRKARAYSYAFSRGCLRQAFVEPRVLSQQQRG